MKHSLFKIRKLGELDTKHNQQNDSQMKKSSQLDALKNTVQTTNDKMLQLMGFFETFLKSQTNDHPSSQLPTAITQGNLLQDITKDQKQFRDRHIYIPLPKNTQVSQKQMEIWMTEVYTAAFSTSFHYYLTEQLTFQQTKVFCSQNILRNLLLFTQRFKLNDKQIKNLNKHAGQEVLQYLQKKYPLTQSNDVNRALQKEIQQTNHLDMMVNDFLFIHGIMFKYREDGNYNDLIMKVINKAIQIAEQPSKMTSYNEQKKKYDQQSNYTDFQNYMANLFENVFDEAWMNGSKTKVQKLQSDATKIAKKINSESHKEKYEQKVRSYTNYLIGRKLSQNTVPFSQQQILGKNLVIKSPAILRILTKWCEQLWQKFENQTYFTERAQPIQLQDQQTINPFFKWMKTSIQKRTAEEKKSIILFKADLDNNNYSLQADYLIKHLASDNNTSILKYEKASGKFAVHMVKNLHSYVILYLNRLIHGLVTVSKNFQDKQIDKSWTQWQTPLNLLTFKIGDFLRCRISSRQKEIVSIFKELKSISNTNPQKLKIIRIKNRLRRGTNDILINIKFNNLIVCEIQLEVINKSKTKFIQCSNSFSHYIYQMKRSIFGPVSQLCNIWNNLEARALQYEQHLRQINEQVRQELKCTNEQNKHNFVVFKLPFQCSYCLRIFYHNNYILQNKKCNICLTYKCVKCEINDTPEQQLKKIFFMKKSQQQLAKSCKKSIGKTRVKVGICFKIESYVRVPQIFKIHTIEGRTWILSKRGDKIYSIKKIRSNKDYEEFSQNYCVFQIINNELNFIKIDAKAAQNFGAEQYLIESYKQQKEVLILTQLRFTVAQMEKLMKIDGGYQKNKKKIKRIQFASNYVDSIAYFSAFENLTSINLDYNDFRNMKQLSYFPKLQKLEFRDNSKLEQFSEEVCELTRLEQIKITNCKIKSLPETISKLTALQILKMDINSLKELPDSICSLLILKQLSLSKNTFSKLPTQIGNLVNLKKLNLKGCNLTQLPVSFGKLENLTALDLSNNKITILPNNLLYLTCIQTLRLNNNQLSIFPQNFPFTQSLQILSLNNNHFTNLPNNFAACKNLSILNLHANSITQIPSTLQNCFNISQLTLQNNKIKEIPQWFQNLGKLPNKQIILHTNCISVFPSFIFELDDVVKIDLSTNQITAIPQRISQLQTLQTLNLKTNKITTLAEGLSKIQKLKIFEITNNLIEQLPIYSKDIAQNKNNPNFFINYQMNKISKIEAPELFDAIVTTFQLPNNCLIQIPTQLRKYKDKIKVISLSHNLIKEIPRWISEFTSLTSLYLADNQIELIPKQIEDLTYPRLSTLGLQRNPITVIECVQFVKRYPFYRLLNLDSAKAPQVKPIVKDKDDEQDD